MKFIKTQESFFDVKYEVGDYVILSNDVFCEIIEVNNVTQSYKVEFLYKGRISEAWADERHVTEKMTTEQIEKFEVEKASIKYNL